MTDFATEVARYQAMEPEWLAQMIGTHEHCIRTLQAQVRAMRKAQRRQATLAKGGKLPQHTKTG
jgi:hypothetical protein